MNNNSTQTEIRNFVKKLSYLKKTAIAFTAVLLIVCSNVITQNTDLPNPDANLKTAPGGSVIIAMDNTNHGTSGIFNLKAYGLGASANIFPNKALRVENINLNNLPLSNNSIVVNDLTGKSLINFNENTGNIVKLNISALEVGTYYVKVSAGDGKIFQNKNDCN